MADREAAEKARQENNRRVLDGQIPPRPTAVASCPVCLTRDCDILPDPITKCPDCAFRHDAVHTPLHRIKVCWYWCPSCNLAYSGEAGEFEAERERRTAHVAPAPTPQPVALTGTPAERVRALRTNVAQLGAAVTPPGSKEIHDHAASERAWEATQLAADSERSQS